MKSQTNHHSFILKPSKIEEAGIGVFALHDIERGAYFELFTDKFEEEICEPSDIPKDLQGYCLDPEDGKLLCPKYFNRLDIGNYLNHSPEPNITYKKDKGYFAMQNISKDEELLADYRELGEPEETWAVYYN